MKNRLIFLSLVFLVACKGGESEQKVSNPPTQGHGNQSPPVPEPPPGPKTVDEETFYPDLTPFEISKLQGDLASVLGGNRFEARPLLERQTLVGAGLEQAFRNQNLDIDWQAMTEKDLKHLLNLFLTDDLKQKKENL